MNHMSQPLQVQLTVASCDSIPPYRLQGYELRPCSIPYSCTFMRMLPRTPHATYTGTGALSVSDWCHVGVCVRYNIGTSLPSITTR